MANPTISQIKVGNTTYDINDAGARAGMRQLNNALLNTIDIATEASDKATANATAIGNLTGTVNQTLFKWVRVCNHNPVNFASGTTNEITLRILTSDFTKNIQTEYLKKGYHQLGVTGIDGTPTGLVVAEMANASETEDNGGGCTLTFYNVKSSTIKVTAHQIKARILLWKTSATIVNISDS